jgi:hypothetical protein
MADILKKWKIPMAVYPKAMVAVWLVLTGFVRPIQAASCCGGGSSASLVLPKFATFLFDTSFEHEKYNGFWDSRGTYEKDPEGSDLRQLRINTGVAYRIHDNIQMFLSLPYIINLNEYTGVYTGFCRSKIYGRQPTWVPKS